MRKAVVFATLLGIAATATAAVYFGMREIHKDSALASLIDVPRRGADWVLTVDDGTRLQMPSQRAELERAASGNRLSELSTLIELRDVNIDAMRNAARQLEALVPAAQFLPAYRSPASMVLVTVRDSADVEGIIPVVKAFPAGLRMLAVAAPGQKGVVEQALRANGVPVTVVEEQKNPHLSAPAVGSAQLAAAIYPLRARDGSAWLPYTVFHRSAKDLSWPDVSFLDDVAGVAGMTAVRMPLAGSSADILLAKGQQKDLFIAESLLREEASKRERLLLPRPSREGLLEAYRRTFSADRVFTVDTGNNSLSSFLLFSGDGNAVLSSIPHDDPDRHRLGDLPVGRLSETLLSAGYKVHLVPTTAAHIREGRSPLAGPYFFDKGLNRPVLLVPLTGSKADGETLAALSGVGVHVIPFSLGEKYAAISRYVAAL